MPEVYLTPEELSQLIKFSKQSIYNLIHKNTFIQGVHYFKPTKKKILFKASAIKDWVEGASGSNGHNTDNEQSNLLPAEPKKTFLRINI